MIIKVEKKYNLENIFNSYKLTYSNGEIWFVPLDENNRHYKEIQKWIAEGGEVIDNPPIQENN